MSEWESLMRVSNRAYRGLRPFIFNSENVQACIKLVTKWQFCLNFLISSRWENKKKNDFNDDSHA